MIKTKKRRYFSIHRISAFAALLGMVGLSMMQPLAAQTVTQGYAADKPMQRGMIVQIKKDDPTKVEPVSIETMEQLHGVVVDANDAPVTLSAEGEKVFVATTGRFAVLVSDQNGPIGPGDYITVSSVNGIGMKATSKDPLVVAKALDTFDGQKNVISTVNIKDTLGNERSVNIGRIESADITVSRNPLLKAEEPNLPEFLRKATEQIAGKPVSALKAYISLVIVIISTFIAGSLLYGGVRSGITSIGRNPLSKRSIIRGMLQVVITGLTVFICGLLGVYLLLKL